MSRIGELTDIGQAAFDAARPAVPEAVSGEDEPLARGPAAFAAGLAAFAARDAFRGCKTIDCALFAVQESAAAFSALADLYRPAPPSQVASDNLAPGFDVLGEIPIAGYSSVGVDADN